MKCRFSFLATFLLVIVISSARAQSYQDFVWTEGNLVLLYPADWDVPFPTEQDGVPVLQIAQSLADNPTIRPPGIPIIELKRIPPEFVLFDADALAVDLPAMIRPTLEANGLLAGPLLPAQLAGEEALATRATSDDGTLVGMMRAATLNDGSVLLIWGRWPAEAQLDTVFDTVANSLVLGIASQPIQPAYGVLWRTQSLPTDGEDAFLDVVSIAFAGDTIALLDEVAGVFRFSAQSGLLLDRISLPDGAQATDIALTTDGIIYLADSACTCVWQWRADVWAPFLSNFDANYPIRIALSADGVLAATDYKNGNFVVRIQDGVGERVIFFEEPLSAAPFLTFDEMGMLYALTNDGIVYAQDGVGFSQVTQIPPLLANDFIINDKGHYIIATENEGILIYDREGNERDRLGRLVANFPLPGELVEPRGLAVNPDGTLYWADSDGQFGNITAMSQEVQQGRVGATALVPNRPVMGTLDAFITKQVWTYDADGDSMVQIAALSDDGGLGLALRILDPNGREIAYTEQNDALLGNYLRLDDLALTVVGTYYLIVERISGEGGYQLGLSARQHLSIDGGFVESVGELSPLFPTQQWVIAGQAGQVITITMIAEGGAGLDPLLRLQNVNGTVLAENDDADDTTLGRDAQIVDFRLPSTGTYIIEAAQFDGYGPYRLIIVVTA